MSTFAELLGRRIRSTRRAKGLTQRELAADAGVSVSFLSDVENGKRNLSLVNAVNIAWALDVSLLDLLPR